MNEWVVLPKLHECTIYTSMKAVAGGSIGCQRLNHDNRHRKRRKPPPSAVIRRVRGVDDDRDNDKMRLWGVSAISNRSNLRDTLSSWIQWTEICWAMWVDSWVDIWVCWDEILAKIAFRHGTGVPLTPLWWPLPVGTFSFTHSSILGKRVVDVKKKQNK